MYYYVCLLACYFCFTTIGIAQTTGGLQGKVIDIGNDEGLPFASLSLEQNKVAIVGTQSDFDGNYNFSNVPAGTYDLIVSYIGFPTVKTEELHIKANQVTRFDIEMEEGTNNLQAEEIMVRAYSIPLIKQDAAAGGQTLGAEDIKNLATRSVTSIVSTTAGVSSADEGEAINSNGTRSSSNDIYIDGVRVIGNFEIPETEIKEVQIITSGVPAEFENGEGNPNITIQLEDAPAPPPPPAKVPEPTNEEYSSFVENEYFAVQDEPLSTFSIDVDRASYSIVRRHLTQMQKPPKDAVRIEEMVNYFNYSYPEPTTEHPFAVVTEVSDCPWNKDAQLVHIGLQGKKMNLDKAVANNLVFLIDVSGSMSDRNKLPLVKESLRLLINNMRDQDKMALVVYAGAAGVIQAPTSNKQKLLKALDNLESGGSTAGGQGIELAYKLAKDNYVEAGNNRIILATDGDFNIGIYNTNDLEKLIVEKRKDHIFLTVLGFGMGNYKDNRMETLADKGNGNYAYIDNIREAKKTLVNEMTGTLYTIAKDVKLQLEFNPMLVESYRLVGYENRKLKNEDFNDDTKDAGELGAGHTVTAMYEVVLANEKTIAAKAKKVDDLKYQTLNKKAQASTSNELLTVKLRYKAPKGDKSVLMEHALVNESQALDKASENFRFAAAVAGFGMLLRDSKFKNELTYKEVLDLAKSAKGADKDGYREEFIGMVKNVNMMTLHAKK